MKNINGVDTVDVSLNKGLAAMKMKPGNNVTMKQLLDAIAKNGFSTKQSAVILAGEIVQQDGKVAVRVSGSNELYYLSGEPAQARSLMGKKVIVEGTIPEVAKGKVADSIQPKTITEDTTAK